MKLQKFRRNAGLTQSELSKLAKINLRTLQEYENGRRLIDNAHIDTLINIADVFNIPFYELMDDNDLTEKIKANIKREG